MEEEFIGKHDVTHSMGKDLITAFELTQQEIQAESMRLFQARFEKEKIYWENLAASKDQTIAGLHREIQEAEQMNQDLKAKLDAVREDQSQIVQQTFNTIELQKRAMGTRIKNLEWDIEASRKEAQQFRLDLADEIALREKMRQAWEETERSLLDEQQKREMEIEKIKQSLYERRQKELEEVSQLDEMIKNLKNEISEKKSLFETDKVGLQNQVTEKDVLIEYLQRELTQIKSQLDREREDRKLASVEREHHLVKSEEDRKRIAEQLAEKENKVKELQTSLEEAVSQKESYEESIRSKEEELARQEVLLSKRREEWVESVKGQTTQQLSISDKIVDLLNKFENAPGQKPSIKPPPLVRIRAGATPAVPAPPIPAKPSRGIMPFMKKMGETLPNANAYIRKNKWLLFSIAGFLLFVVTTLLFVFEGHGRRSASAQKYLKLGNEQYTQGDMDNSLRLLEKAYNLDSDNSIIKNSFTLILGEIANRDFREGRIKEAAKKTELLYELLPEDPDVVRLHGQIMQELGRSQEPSP